MSSEKISTLPSMDQEFLDLKENNYFSMLKLLAKHDESLVKNQVNAYGEDNISFFMSFLPYNNYKESQEETRQEFLEFCINYGYKVDNNTYVHNGRTTGYGNLRNKEQETIPDYLQLISMGGSDQLLLLMTEKLGSEYFLELEKVWDFMPYLYKNKFTNTIKKLTEYGVANKPNILEYAEKEMVNVYWQMVQLNQDTLESEQRPIDKDISWLKNKLVQVDTVKESFAANSIKEYIKVRFPTLSLLDKQRIIIELMASKDLTVLNTGFKLLSTNLSKYKSDQYPLWTGIGKINSSALLNIFLDKPLDFNSYHQPTGQYLIKEIFTCLKNLHVEVNIQDQKNKNNNIQARDYSIMKRINNLIPADFWLSTVKNKEHSWATEMCTTLTPYTHYAAQKIKSLIFEDRAIWAEMMHDTTMAALSQRQKEHMQNVFEKTIFQSNDQGVVTLEILNNYGQENPMFYLVNEKFINRGLSENIFTSRHKEILLTSFINTENIAVSNTNQLCQTLYDNMAEDPSVKWANIKFQENREKDLNKYQLYFEIKARALVEKLENKIPDKTETISKKNKI